MVKPRDGDLVRPLCSAGSSPKTSRSRAGLPTSAGRSPLLSLLLLLLLPLMPSESALRGRPMLWKGCLPHSRGPGSRFCRWRLGRCWWYRGPHLRYVVEVGLAVQVFHPPSTLIGRALPARPPPRCRLPLFGARGELLRGREMGRGYLLWCASTWRWACVVPSPLNTPGTSGVPP